MKRIFIFLLVFATLFSATVSESVNAEVSSMDASFSNFINLVGTTIMIDGDPNDWTGITPFLVDQQGDSLSTGDTDILNVSYYLDSTYAYLMVRTTSEIRKTENNVTVELNLDLRPGNSVCWRQDELHLNISPPSKFYAWTRDTCTTITPYQVPADSVTMAWDSVLEVRILRSALGTINFFRPIFTAIWTNLNAEWTNVDLVQPIVSGTVYGTVMAKNPDGAGNLPLHGLRVELFQNGSSLSATTTDPVTGYYYFSLPSVSGNYKVRASLIQPGGQGIGGFEIKFMPPLLSDPIPYVETAEFNFSNGTYVARDLTIGDNYINAGGKTNLDSSDYTKLDDLGVIFYHLDQVERFAVDQLGVNSAGYVTVHAYDNHITGYRPSDMVIFFNNQDADDSNDNRPENREWHEYFHHVMAETILTNATNPSCGNHEGFLNSTTTDSWEEGFAIFWAEILGESLGEGNTPWYVDWFDLDTNYQSWDSETGNNGQSVQREDLR